MAAVYEIIRQKKKNLHLYAHSNGQGVDELIGGECVERIEIAYAGTGRFAPTCIRFRKAVQSRRIEVEDYSNYHMTLRFMAGSMGVPFLPTRSGLGTDIISKWGFGASFRKDNPKIPDKKLQVIDNPFRNWGQTSQVVAVPAIHPDITILHVQKADSLGNVRIEGLPFADVVQAKAARRVIVTCEELVESDFLRKYSDCNQIPSFCVDAVVHLPWGAYPTACYNYYDYDPVYLKNYGKWAQTDDTYRNYLDRFVFQVDDHQIRIERAGKNRKEQLKADPETGYATGLDRR